MATYATDFSEYTTGVQPSDWTERLITTGGTATVETGAGMGGQQLEIVVDAVTTGYLLSWDEVDPDADRADAEIVIKYKVSTVQLEGLRVGGRFVGQVTGGDPTDGYFLETGRDFVTGKAELRKYLANSRSDLGTSFAFAQANNVWYWVRIRLNGTTQKVRMWDDGDTEPGTWNQETADTSVTAPGWVGVGFRNTTGVTYTVDFMGIGTNGDTAPDDATVPPTPSTPISRMNFFNF